MKKMQIGEVAKRTGVTLRTVRYYEGLGLLGETRQEENGFHYYDECHIERLQKIAVLKQLGLSLQEIRSVIDLYFESQLKGKRRTLQILKEHLAETDQKIGALESFRSELVHNIERMEKMIRELE